ncbi:hypothetical protein GGI11_006526 [Coemansia sp. RSA 2049]|nr:hypothetical protein GGI11_006526 [Coemansia sp. RSA 2049]
MKFFATLFIGAAAVLAQQQENNQGPNASTGPNAVSNPNVNNGFQAQGSLFDGSVSGGNAIDGIADGSFNHGASNEAVLDSNFVNPSENKISGNRGETANGANNQLGDFVQGFGGRPFGAFRRRDTVLNNNRGGFPVVERPLAVVEGIHRPVGSFGIPAVGRVNHNGQEAGILQNQF